jgi:hypothetical protein
MNPVYNEEIKSYDLHTSYVCNMNVYLLRIPFITNSKANSKVQY